MIKEMRGIVTDVRDGMVTISCGIKKIKASTVLPFTPGRNIHFFCDDKTGDFFEPVFNSPKTADDIREYISLSGRIPGISKSDADVLTETELVQLTQSSDNVLDSVRKKLGDKKTDTLINYFKTQPMNDAAYLSLKRKCPFITWEAFSKCVGDPPRAVSLREITNDPYGFFKKSEMPYDRIDKAASALGAKGDDEERIDAFVNDLFSNKGLKSSACCPKDVLIKCISQGINISEARAADYVKRALFNDKLIMESDANDVYVFLPLQNRIEHALAEDIKNACKRKISIPGASNAIKSCKKNGIVLSGAEEEIFRHVAKDPVYTIVTEDGMRGRFLAETCLACLKVPYGTINPGGKVPIWTSCVQDGRYVKIVTAADTIPYTDYINLFKNLGPEEKLILIGENKDRKDVAGRVFLDVAGFVTGAAALDHAEGKYSMLDTFLKRNKINK